jgi:uncharacterized protein (TIGR02646 family)
MMREYKYRSIPIPKYLNSPKIQNEFKKNIIQKEYTSKNTPYNDYKKIVKTSLKDKLYNNKCAYCESTLSNTHAEIEHYRPKKYRKFKNVDSLKKCNSKNAYYWLAFSWDNLIPCCEICNNFKSSCFDISNSKNRAKYKDESLEELHKSLEEYNKSENPKLLHPEIDKFENNICFRKKGQLLSKNNKVKYTVRICKLNRKNLCEAREKIITKHLQDIKKYFKSLLNLSNQKESLDIKDMLLILSNTFDNIFEKSNKKEEYSLVSLYIITNFEIFINTIPKLTDNDKKILLLLWDIYIKEKNA